MTDQDDSTDFYRLLRVTPAATLDEIRDAVRQQRRHFSNRANNSPDSAARFEAQQKLRQLALAESTLTDPAARNRYDALHGFDRGGRAGGDSHSPWSAPSSRVPPDGRPLPPPIPPVSPPLPPDEYGPSPPLYPPGEPITPGQRTNGLAVAALVSLFFFWPCAIIFGHLARRQIRRTHEQGAGLALFALVAGYSLVGLVILIGIWLYAYSIVATSVAHSP